MVIFEIKDLSTKHKIGKQEVEIVSSINLCIKEGEIVGLAGESGCGKTTLVLSLLGLLGEGAKVEGEALLDGYPLPLNKKRGWHKVRGSKISYVPQDSLAGLNPVLRVGTQLRETIKIHEKVSSNECKQKAILLLKKVKLSDPLQVYKSFPHQLSGGQRQRVLIAIAMAGKPKLLIADEPTTALDVTTQSGILKEIKNMSSINNTAVLYISHDLGVISGLADRIAIMYGGSIVEIGDVKEVFNSPAHPYTKSLLDSIPKLYSSNRLKTIKGMPPSVTNIPDGCTFHTRCMYAKNICRKKRPKLTYMGKEHCVACFIIQKEFKYGFDKAMCCKKTL